MYKYRNLAEMFTSQGQLQDRGVTFIDSSKSETFVSYRDLYQNGMRVLGDLQRIGLKQGEELIFQIEDNQTFLNLFVACMLGGILPVPVTLADNEERFEKLLKIKRLLNTPRLAVNSTVFASLQQKAERLGVAGEFAELETCLVVTDELGHSEVYGTAYDPQPDEIAFIQFSSGSTGDPKGVILTHRNLITNLNAVCDCFQMNDEDVSLSWMPLTHDMGLICVFLSNAYYGIRQAIMPPALFVKRPALWLKKAAEHRATLLSMPNFGFKHVLAYSRYETLELDLSHVKLIANGAEPVNIDLCAEFLDAMAGFGLPAVSMLPVYGLAEASVGVTCPPIGEPYRYVIADRRRLNIGQEVVETDRDNPHHLLFADVGLPLLDVNVRICDADDRPLPDNVIGAVQISGGNVTQGYYNNPAATGKALTADGWVNTGDLGFLRDGRLVITGRAKDIIFINGQNYYPHDIERLAEEVEGIELGRVAAAGVYDRELGREEVVLFVVMRGTAEEFLPLALALKKLLNARMGLSVRHIVPIAKMPRTTSGKIQRYLLAEEFVNGDHAAATAEISRLMQEQLDNRETAEPRTELEQDLVRIWSDVLQVKHVGIYDNFLELGGNSNLLVQVVSQIEEKYPDTLTLQDTFTLPNIAKLAEFMLAKSGQKGAGRQGQNMHLLHFPKRFFTGEGAAFADVEPGRFTLETGAEVSAQVRTLAADLEVQSADVVFALYVHLLSKLTGQTWLSLQVLTGETQAAAMAVELTPGETLEGLTQRIAGARRETEQAGAYNLTDLIKVHIKKADGELLPLFALGETADRRLALLDAFDYVLTVEERADSLRLACDFNERRLDTAALRALHESLLKTIEAVTNRYQVNA